MAARAIDNGQTMTLRLDADLVLNLKMTALQSRIGVSELIGRVLGNDWEDGTIKRIAGLPTAPTVKPRKPAMAASKPATAQNPQKNGTSSSTDLFTFVDGLIHDGRFTQAEVEQAAGVGKNNFGSWRKHGECIPGKHVPAIQAFLESKGVAFPATASPAEVKEAAAKAQERHGKVFEALPDHSATPKPSKHK